MTRVYQSAGGGDGRRPGRTRMCAVTREVRPEAELIRFVATPDGSVVADIRAKLPGRGIWIGLERERVEQAVCKNLFSRGLKEPLRPPAQLADEVALRLREAALGRLGLARKAGAAIAGFTKVEVAIGRENVAAVLVAVEAAEDGRRKVAQALRRRFGSDAGVPVLAGFTTAELGLALGRPDVIHAAVLQSPAGRTFVEAALRLQRYEGIGQRPAADTSIELAGRPAGRTNDRYDE